MSGWTFYNPVRVRFGEGVLSQIGELVDDRPYILVTHPDAPMIPWRTKIEQHAGRALAVVDEIEPNPSLTMLKQICERLAGEGHRPELIVALGGGSVIDSGKFLAAGHCAYDPVHAYLGDDKPFTRPSLPLIAIPTTSGTGSDLTKWATIWDPEHGQKLSLNRDDLYAEATLVDPMLTVSLPWSMTVASGLDALSHALESLWNVNANPVSRTHAVQAARDIMSGLPRLKNNLADAAARKLMALGATRAGFAFSNTQTALAHNISYPLTLDHGLTHGIACSFCLPEVMRMVLGVNAECDAALVGIFGDLNAAPETLRAFLNDLDIPHSPAAIGVGAEEWRRIVTDAFAGPRGRNFIGKLEWFPFG